jgi:hypothetical protein
MQALATVVVVLLLLLVTACVTKVTVTCTGARTSVIQPLSTSWHHGTFPGVLVNAQPPQDVF